MSKDREREPNEIPVEELFAFALKARITTPAHVQVMRQWANTDSRKLVARPYELQQCLAAQKALSDLAVHPAVQAAIQEAKQPQAQTNPAQQAEVWRSEIQQANSNQALYDSGMLQSLPVPQQRSYSPQQVQVQRGPGGYVYFDATPPYRRLAEQIQAPAGAYGVEPQQGLTTKALVENVQREIQELPVRIVRELEKHQQPKKVTKSQVKGQTSAQRTAARLMAQVQRSKAAPAEVRRSEPAAPVFNPANPDFSILPSLPIGSNGKPSLLAAQTRASMGMGVHPILHCSPFHQEQFLRMQGGI